MWRKKGKRSRTSAQQAAEDAKPVEFTETIHPCVILILRPGNGDHFVATIIRNRENNTYSMDMRYHLAEGGMVVTPATSWHPAVEGGPPKAWLAEMEKFAAETAADGGTVKRIEFPNDVHPNEALRILLESGETTFPGCDSKERH